MTVREAEKCTPYEYHLYIKAKQYQDVDQSYWVHALAWANETAGATKKNGRRVYRKFDQFFDYEKAIKQVANPTLEKTAHSIAETNMRLSEYRRAQKEG